MSLKFQYFDVIGTLSGSCMPDNVVVRDGFEETAPLIGRTNLTSFPLNFFYSIRDTIIVLVIVRKVEKKAIPSPVFQMQRFSIS